MLLDVSRVLGPYLKEIERAMLSERYSSLFKKMAGVRDRRLTPREESLEMEHHTAVFLQKACPWITVPRHRTGLADLLIDDNYRFPINLKFVSSRNPSSNFNLVSATSAIHHMFFNHRVDQVSDYNVATMIRYREYSGEFNDIGFVVVEKETGAIRYGNLLSMINVYANAKNGFQTSLSRFGTDPNRHLEDSRRYLIGKYCEILEKQARAANVLSLGSISGE